MLYIKVFVMKLSNHLVQWLPWMLKLEEFIVQSVMLEFLLYFQLQLSQNCTDSNGTFGILGSTKGYLRILKFCSYNSL